MEGESLIWMLAAALLVGLLLGGQLMSWLQSLVRSVSQLILVAAIVLMIVWVLGERQPKLSGPENASPTRGEPKASEWWR